MTAPDAELLPVKPLIELDMVDPRFVATLDVMSGLDHRPNLMELTPTEFEGLITELFAHMGLDTRQTRPSRDGGVDCVAFDPRPAFGGKVVIQAKRYKNTVGVSAVRDLFGTVQNEGASKGILVTTSGYGKAAFDSQTASGSNCWTARICFICLPSMPVSRRALLCPRAGLTCPFMASDAWPKISYHMNTGSYACRDAREVADEAILWLQQQIDGAER